MGDLSVRCACGKETIVSEWAIGAPLRCKACGKPLVATEKNTRRVEEPSRGKKEPSPDSELPPPPEARIPRRNPTSAAPTPRAQKPSIPKAAPLPGEPATPEIAPKVPSRSTCSRCGRAFRGDWDMYRRSDEILCHVCANLYKTAPEGEADAAPADTLPPPTGYKGVLDDPMLPRDAPGPSAGRTENQEQIRRVVMVLGILVVVLTAVWLLSGGLQMGQPPPPSPEEIKATADKIRDLPKPLLFAIQAIMFFFRFGTTLVALYILLRWREKLPNEYFLANVVSIGLVAGFIAFLGLMLNMVPCLGPLLYIVLALYILWEIYDLEFADFVILGIIMLLLQPVMFVVQSFILGSIHLIFT